MPRIERTPMATTTLEQRVRGEFQEMPGLRLTLQQACRLWDIDSTACAAVLERLVASGVLYRVGPYYFRADFGQFTA